MDNFVCKNNKKKRRAFEKALKQNLKRAEKHADVDHALKLSSQIQTAEEKRLPQSTECDSTSSCISATNQLIWGLLVKHGFSKNNAVEAKVTFSPDLDKILRDPNFPSWEEIQNKCQIHTVPTSFPANFSQNFSEKETHGHLTETNIDAKPGTSRRRGGASTRNTPSIILNRIDTSSSPPHVTPISSYNAQRQFESRPTAVPPRPETFHRDTAIALREFKLAYNENELWYNPNAFYLKYSRNVRDIHNRKCCHCKMQFSSTQTVIFTHIEKYEYFMKNQVRIGYGERICCAKEGCFISRYPYADMKCIISEVSRETTDEILNFIFELGRG